MRDTSEIIPAVHPISGAPLGEPLTTWRVGRAHDSPRLIAHIAISTQQMVDGHPSWVLWHSVRDRYLYRTVAPTPRNVPDGAVVVDVSTYRYVLTVAGESWRAIDPEIAVRTPKWWEAFTVDFVLRGHAAGLPRLLIERYIDVPPLFDGLAADAPIALSRDAASDAAILHMTTAELACSVRAEHGRWLVETGVGSKLTVHGSCATKGEAIVVAQAIRDRAWIARVEEIRIARGGLLDWGTPVVMPYPVAVYP